LPVGRAIEGTVLLGDAEASIAIIVTNMQVATESVVNLEMRCDVFVVNIFLSEPLSMAYKFTGSDHTSLYDQSTFTQLCF
jgi:hypothetical protein